MRCRFRFLLPSSSSAVAPPSFGGRLRARRGVALVLAFAVLVALFLIVLPFVRSMHTKREIVQSHVHFLEARRDAESARALAFARLRQTHTAVQQRQANDPDFEAISRWILHGVDPPITPDVDTVYEFDVEPLLNDLLVHRTYMERQELLDVQSARGRLWSVRVEDEQGKVCANTASPVLLGNLMGGTILADDITEQQQSIPIEFGGGLPPRNGFVIIGNELIFYEACLPGSSPGQPWQLVGCIRGRPDLTRRFFDWNDVSRLTERRGLYGDEFAHEQEHLLGTAVIPGIAYKLHRFKVEPVVMQRPARFRDVPGMRVVENYPLFGGGPSERLTDEQYEAARPFLSTVSQPAPLGYPSWFLPHVYRRTLRNQVEPWIELDDNRGIQPGSVLRFTTLAIEETLPVAMPDILEDAFYWCPPMRRTQPPQPRVPPDLYEGGFNPQPAMRNETFAMVVEVDPTRPNRVRLDRAVDDAAYDHQTIVEVLRRAPVNINTAPVEVLIALFHGVAVRGSEGVPYYEAAELARAIYERVHHPYTPEPFVDHADFQAFLLTHGSNIGLEAMQIQALILNARVNHHPMLISPTAPLVFRSYDTFTVEVTAKRTTEPLDGSPGMPLAEHGIRDVITFGSSGIQGEVDHTPMARLLEMRQSGFGGGLRIEEGPRETGIISLPIKADEESSNEELEIFRDFSGLGRYYEEVAEFGAEPIVSDEDAVQPYLTNGRIAFWIRPEALRNHRETVLFDLGEEEYSNRLSVVYDSQREALVMRMADATLDRAFEEVVYPMRDGEGAALPWWRDDLGDEADAPGVPAMRDEVWYHIEAFWQGVEFRDTAYHDEVIPVRMTLLIDGLPVSPIYRNPSYESYTRYGEGDSTSQISVRLAAPLPSPDPLGRIEDPNVEPGWWRVVVEDARDLPPSGVINVNGEAIAYSVKQGNVLTGIIVEVEGEDHYEIQGFQRGARGTDALSHITESTVRPFGYSARLVYDRWAEYLPAVEGQTVDPAGVRSSGRIINSTFDPDYIDSQTYGPESGLPPVANDLQLYIEDFPPSGYMLVHGYAVDYYEEIEGEDETIMYRAVLHGASDPDNNHPPNYPGRVCYEIIYYDGVEETGDDSWVMQNVVRNALPVENIPENGYQGQGVFNFINLSNVDVISWKVVPNTNYLSEGGFVQLEESNEVLRYTGVEGEYLVFNDATRSRAQRANAWRGQLSTGRTTLEHPAVQRVFPVFRVRGRNNVRRPLAVGDHLTVVHGQNERRVNTHADDTEQDLRVFWTRPAGLQEQWVTLDGFVPFDYVPYNHPENPVRGTRVLKWPSGELPAVVPRSISIGGRSQGWAIGDDGACGRFEVDELRIERHRLYEDGIQGFEEEPLVSYMPLFQLEERPSSYLALEAVIEGFYPELGNLYTQLVVEFDPREYGFNEDVGIIKLGDELIAYRGIEEVIVEDPDSDDEIILYIFDMLVRGFLNTPIRNHQSGTEIIDLYPMRAVWGYDYQNGEFEMPPGMRERLGFSVMGDDPESPIDREGYLLAGYLPHQWEVIGYRRESRTSSRLMTSYYRPGRVDLGRGRFGTRIQNMRTLPDPPVFVALPYRYHDRYAAPWMQRDRRYGWPALRTFNSPDQYLAAGAACAAGGRWQSVTWGMMLHESMAGEQARPRRDGVPQVVDDHLGAYVEAVLLLKPSTVNFWQDEHITALPFPSHDQINPDTYNLAQAVDPDTGRVLPWAEFNTDEFFRITYGNFFYADAMEWRIAIAFRRNAFHADAWKYSPRVLGPRLYYTCTDVLHESRTTSR